MAQIISSGIGSGLDIGGLVSQLVAAERAPVENRLNTNQVKVQAKLSAYASLKSSLSTFQSSLNSLKDSGLYENRKAVLSNKELFTVSTTSAADVGSYSIQAQQLASRHKIASTAYTDSATAVGTGSLDISINGESFSVTVEAGNDSLAAIRDAINNAPGNVGVSASIVNDQDGSHLVLTSKETGADNAITVAVTTGVDDTGDLGNLAFDPEAEGNPMTVKQAAQDAILIIDGFTANSASNTFDNVIDGISLTLKGTEPGQAHKLDVNLDDSKVKTAVQQFVTAYNSLRNVISKLNSYNPDTQVAGLLQGDSTTSRLSAQLRTALTATINNANSDLDTLAEIGITTNFENGNLKIDNNKLDGLLASSFDSFGALFAGDNGFAARMAGISEGYTRFEGILENRSNGLESQLDRISDQRETLNRRMISIEARYQAQFTALDGLLGELNQTSNFLTSQLKNLPGFTREK